MRNLPARLQFRLERLLQRGLLSRLFLIAAVLALVAVVSGTAVWLVHDGFDELPASIWWAFLRLTDPGYLGDDSGVWNRLVSTAVTLVGYVLFMGVLVATMTQWLHQTVDRLARGETPIFRSGHILVLGWTDRTPDIVRELILSEGRVRRFLSTRGTNRLHVVILAEEVGPHIHAELRLSLGARYSPQALTLRSGDLLRVDHLERVAFQNAAAIIIPGVEQVAVGEVDNDTAMIKALLSISSHPLVLGQRRPPRVVAELFDRRMIDVAEAAYEGQVQVVCSDQLISRVIARSIENPGLSVVISELFTHDIGNEAYVRCLPELDGVRFADAAAAFDDAVLVGIVRNMDAVEPDVLVLPPPDTIGQPGDGWLCLARSYERCSPLRGTVPGLPLVKGRSGDHSGRSARRVLLLGWNDGLPALLEELGAEGGHPVELVHVSTKPANERALAIEDHGARCADVVLVDGDITFEPDLRALGPDSFDSVVLLRSDRYSTRDNADARTIVAYVLLKRILDECSDPPHLLIELAGAQNQALFRRGHGEVLVSPLLTSNMLALVALRPALLGFVDQLLASRGPEFQFRRPEALLNGGPPTFRTFQHAVALAGELAVGMYWPNAGASHRGDLRLGPPRDELLNLDGARVVVLTRA